MLAELVKFSEQVALIMRSGIQFMDFGLTLDLRKEPPGEFMVQTSLSGLARLEYDDRADRYVHPANPQQSVKPKFSVGVDESLRLLNECWLPLPYLNEKARPPGPTTWARGRIVALAPGEDVNKYTHRLTIAFDTNLLEDAKNTTYLTPTAADVEAGEPFRLAYRAHQIGWFTEIEWIAGWLRETFEALSGERLRLPPEDVEEEVRQLRHHAHYLNWLAVIGIHAQLPRVVVRSNSRQDVLQGRAPIPVDMVLDVGNSRTCGILIEEHPQQGHGLKNRYELALRDLSKPQRVYAEPFESRIEFAEAVLGSAYWTPRSGHGDSFVWPTIARVGPEAARLAARRRGTEGSTGISSPKRYLWDEDRYQPGWRFNLSGNARSDTKHATGAPFTVHVNELGEALYTLPESERDGVFMPHYTRSAMMTFMLAEVLTQALVQINSPAQRVKQGDPEKPRHLRSIILTVPPSMPKPERDLFAERMRQAMALVWKSLGWHPKDDDLDAVDAAGESTAWPPFPSVHTEWDEATCAQVVYVFSESHEHFGGQPDEFFRAVRRPRPQDDRTRITVASIDIGGGTTDLVVTDYRLDTGAGANVYIIPEQRFRDGFKVAGDDLLLEIVQKMVVPAIEDALRARGLQDPAPLLSKLIGSDTIPVPEAVLRQQLTLQVLYPIGLRILHAYEQYDPVTRAEVRTSTIGELLEGQEPLSEAALSFASRLAREARLPGDDFDIRSVPITIDLNRLHRFFLEDQLEICKAIQALCEIVYMYDCDVLLLSGRPSRLPGVQALFRALLPVPPDRIVPLHGYRAGTWYPFHRDGRIDDPKTTAAVGAMLCKLGGERRILNFSFLTNALSAYSTVRNVGMVADMTIKDSNVYYRDVRLDDPNYVLPDHPFEVRGNMALGFRQLDAERWGASRLYVLELSERINKRLAAVERGVPPVLKVTLRKQESQQRRRDGRSAAERFEIASVTSDQGVSVSPRDLRLSLNTLNTVGIGETSYWLDTGSVIR